MFKRRKQFLAYNLPSIGNEEVKEVVATLRSNWISTGPKTRKFEEEFARYIGTKYAVGLTSCTAAIHLALLAHNIKSGDEVIVPSFTFAATANMVVNVGAKPVFADIDETNFNLDPVSVLSKITKRTKAIILVHYAGQAADLNAFRAIAQQYKLVLIEDAAHSAGTEFENKKIGAHGNTTCFSFYATKNLTTGEGGMLTTNDPKIAEFVHRNRLHGISSDAWKRYSKRGNWRYSVDYAGWKYNMTDLQAALGLPQLKKLDSFLVKRRQLARFYDRQLAGLDGVLNAPQLFSHSYHLYTVRIKSANRDAVIEEMKKMNVGTSVHFIPLHLQPFYKKSFNCKKGDLPVTERVFENILSLPLYPKMKNQDVTYVCGALKNVMAKIAK